MPSAVVTGCAGFIGSHLVEKLIEKHWSVIGFDNFYPNYSKKIKLYNLTKVKNNLNFEFIEGSILKKEDLNQLPTNVNYVFHLAAIPGIKNSFNQPKEYFDTNVIGTSNLLTKFKNVDKFVFSSSSSVYGNFRSEEYPVKEDHILHPISPYGESKKQAEELCINFSKDNGLKIAILRFHSVYGPRQRLDQAFMKFMQKIQIKNPISIYGDGTKERDFTFVSDIINGIILASEKGAGIYNLGSGKPISLDQMIRTLEKIIDKKITRNYIPSPKGEVTKTFANITKAMIELNYFPQFSFERGLKKFVEWFYDVDNRSLL
jgi:UDP-glucuronate 4-epimerase